MSHTLLTFRVFSSQLIRARLFLVAFAAVLLFSGMAQASLIPSLVNGPVSIGGGQVRYDYRIVLSGDERLDPAATNGVTCPGPSNSNVQCSPAGTFVTIYDIPGYISASVTPVDGNFTAVAQTIGPTPNSINGAAFDSPDLFNVTFTYNGPVVNGPATFTGFSIVTRFFGLNPTGNFTSQSTNNSGTSTSGTSDQVIGSVVIPTGQPTAASVNVGGRILTPAGRGVSGIQVTLTDLSSGLVKTIVSGEKGNYSFPDIPVGDTYIIRVVGKRFSFTQNTQLFTVLDEMNEINFTAYGATKLSRE